MTVAEPPRRRGSARSLAAPRADQTLWVALEWIEQHCVVPDGFRKGQPFLLYKGQVEYLGNYYTVRGDAVYSSSNPLLAGAFVYRRGLLVAPQKWGKNPLIAAQTCLEGAGPALFAGWAVAGERYVCADHGCRCGWVHEYEVGEPMGMRWPTPLIQITAFSQESTDNTYDALRPMIDDGPLHDLIPKTGEDFIRLPGGGRIDTVTSSAPSRLGQRVTFVPQDEVGIWTVQNKMVRLADTQYRGLSGMGGRASLTSNAWDPAENSVAQLQYESKAPDIWRQFVQPPKTLSYADKRERHKIHLLVYPEDVRQEHGGHLPLDSIENEAADLVERDLPQAMRFYGNILVAGAGHAVDPDRWDALYRDARPKTGTQVGVGFDGSISWDATVIRACTPEGHSFIWQAWERPTGSDLLRWLAEHPGRQNWEVDRLEVDASVDALFNTYTVGLMLCDTPRWRTEIEGWAEKYRVEQGGKEIERVIALDTNEERRFAKAVDRWLVGIAEGVHTHDADPITDAHVKASHKQKTRAIADENDGRTLYVLVKGSDRRRIDGAVADVLAYEAAMTMEVISPDQPPTLW